ncbi:sulfatase/phosphatase domain-containing protein [Winogradskyella arenosi]|uniref:Uncharacterized protein DUF4976 n=1 Tax=Winogradskyella arenosi TaxID=533325 RepID=A0A368ZBT4_9FLAO|nr:sulfatase/phosphatase domain-containing protein [Winogradskyella arenosi]RCW90330.1 uncharacterized protein DUF4976 [Winogradskyella arenosi]
MKKSLVIAIVLLLALQSCQQNYGDIDIWELYDLEADPEELQNQIENPNYDTIEAQLRVQLKALQDRYKVGNQEFEREPKVKVQRAFKQFERLRGHIGTSYNPLTAKTLNYKR